MSDCRFGVSPINYPDPDPDWFCHATAHVLLYCLQLSCVYTSANQTNICSHFSRGFDSSLCACHFVCFAVPMFCFRHVLHIYYSTRRVFFFFFFYNMNSRP